MRKLVFVLMLESLVLNLHAQFGGGDFAVTISSGLGSSTMTTEDSRGTTSSRSHSFSSYGVAIEYSASENISIEPEVGYFKLPSRPSALYALANASYTHAVPGLYMAPFVRAGLGVANLGGLRIFSGPARTILEGPAGILSVAVGFKLALNQVVSVKTEYSYRVAAGGGVRALSSSLLSVGLTLIYGHRSVRDIL